MTEYMTIHSLIPYKLCMIETVLVYTYNTWHPACHRGPIQWANYWEYLIDKTTIELKISTIILYVVPQKQINQFHLSFSCNLMYWLQFSYINMQNSEPILCCLLVQCLFLPYFISIRFFPLLNNQK